MMDYMLVDEDGNRKPVAQLSNADLSELVQYGFAMRPGYEGDENKVRELLEIEVVRRRLGLK